MARTPRMRIDARHAAAASVQKSLAPIGWPFGMTMLRVDTCGGCRRGCPALRDGFLSGCG